MGSSIEALRAGYHPKNTPTAAAKGNPPITAVGEMSVGQPASADSTFDATIPSAAPASPPTTLSSADSTRNWRSICKRRAPIAMRIPISRVRSVTETSMMFMIPIPPTSNDIDATAASSSVMASLALSEACAISLRLRTVKSSS